MALIKCPNCGREMSDKAVKCPQCQMPIEQIKAALKHEEQNNQEAEQTNPDANTSQVEIPQDIVKPKPEKKKFPTWALVSIIVGLFLLTGGVAFYFYYNNVYLLEKRDSEAPRYYELR